MGNYFFKNVLILVGSILCSAIIVFSVQHIIFDRSLSEQKIQQLSKVNLQFDSELKKIIEEHFQKVAFLASTSYPQVALDFKMDEQFYHTIDHIIPQSTGMKFALLDYEGRWHSLYRFSKSEENILKMIKLSPSDNQIINIYDKYIAYIKGFPANSNAGGFVIGFFTSEAIDQLIKQKYEIMTLDISDLKPQIKINHMSSPSEISIWPFLRLSFSHEYPENKVLKLFGQSLIYMLLIATFLILIFSTLLRRSLKAPVDQLLKIVEFVGSGVRSPYSEKMPSDGYFNLIGKSILKMNDERNKLEAVKRQREIDKKLAETAAQVAHDIRSPLAALSIILPSIEGLETDERKIVTGAISRIQGIASDLLKRPKPFLDETLEESRSEAQPIELLQLVDRVVKEKNTMIQLAGESKIKFNFTLHQKTGIFINASPVELQRAVSNLIDNAIEASLVSKNSVLVTIALEEKLVHIKVIDKGIGIAPEILNQIGKKGFSYGKNNSASGCGLGIYHAKKFAESLHGMLRISSTVGKGTEVSLMIPFAPAPLWFAETIPFNEYSSIVIVDDDNMILNSWRQICRRIPTPAASVIKYYNRPEDLDERDDKALYLVDYEFSMSAESGLSLIRRMGISQHSILVTGTSISEELLEEALDLRVRILPKDLLPMIVKPNVYAVSDSPHLNLRPNEEIA